MKSKLIKLAPLFLISLSFLCFSISTPALAASTSICSNPGISQEIKAASGCGGGGGNLASVIQNILNVVIGLSGIIAVIFIVVGGISFITSSGDAGKIKKAKDTVLYAVIGLIVCALAFVIVNWVVGSLLGQ